MDQIAPPPIDEGLRRAFAQLGTAADLLPQFYALY